MKTTARQIFEKHIGANKESGYISVKNEDVMNAIIEALELSRYTPILDSKTKEPLKLGDRVENNNKQCGILHFDDCFNKYVIKTDTGGHINSTVYIKIPELYDYRIDNTKVECRPHPHKKRW